MHDIFLGVLSVNLFVLHIGWKESFSVIVGGDEVEKGKPSPDM
jgi:beta-phosphoglucomutase-like phosphatase (HAD superfamily)